MSATTARKQVLTQTTEYTLSEWRFVTATIILVLVLTSLPYLYAYLSAPSGKQFMGIMLDVPDHGQYFSWMRELTNAHLAANKLTPEPNRPVFFNLLWWGMGRLGSFLGLGYAGMFQVLRVVAGTLFLLVSYRLCSRFLQDRLTRRIAFLTIAFTSGFGWVLVLMKYTVTDGILPFPLLVYIAEGNTFLGILGYPHFIAAALYILVFDLILQGQTKKQLKYAVAAGLFALFLGWQHAYDLLLVYGILGSYILLMAVRDKRFPVFLIKSGIIVGIISWWPALYSVMLTSLDPLWKEVLAQFANAGVYTPNLLQLPVLLGPAFLLALYTTARNNPLRLNRFNNYDLFLQAWFWANFLLIYVPTDYQIHMLNGWQVPIAILATQGLFHYIVPFARRFISQQRWRWSKEKISHGLAVAFIVLILPTNIYLLLWRFIDLARHDYPYYLHRDEVTAMAWLESNAQPEDITLSSLTIGQYIPALTGTHAFLAHWAQTVDYYGKEDMVNKFFSQTSPDAYRRQIVDDFQVDYIFYGPAEQQLGSYRLDASPLLEQVYTSPKVKIYRVRNQRD